jgi:hypothetical protein
LKGIRICRFPSLAIAVPGLDYPDFGIKSIASTPQSFDEGLPVILLPERFT